MFAAGLAINGVVGSCFNDIKPYVPFEISVVNFPSDKKMRRFREYGLYDEEEIREVILKKWKMRKLSRKLVHKLPEKGTKKEVVKI